MKNNKLRFRNAFAISSLALSVGLGCWFVLPSLAGERGENLVKNGDMSATSWTNSTQPAYWAKNGDVEGVEYAWGRSSDANEKDLCLGIIKRATKYLPIAAWEQTIEAAPDAPAITVRASVKAVNVTKAIIDVIFLDDKGEWMQHKWVAYIGSTQFEDGGPVTHKWKTYEGTVAIPPDAKKIRISLQDYGPGTVYFDDVSASFENDTSKITDAVQVAMASETKLPAGATPGLPPAEKPAVPANTYTTNPAMPSATPVAGYVPATPGLPGAVIAATPATPPAIGARGQYVPQAPSPYTAVAPLNYVPATTAYNQQPQDANYARGNPGAVPQQGNPGWQPFADPIQAVEAVYQQQVPVTKTDYVDGRPVTTTSYVVKHITSDGQQFSLQEIAVAHAQTLRLAASLQKETDADAKAKLREELTAAVTNEYQQLRAERQKEVDELAKKLEDVRASLAKRDEEKSKVIDARVEHLATTKPQAVLSYNRPVNSQQYATPTFLAPTPIVPPVGGQFNPVGIYQSTPPAFTSPAPSTVQSEYQLLDPNAPTAPRLPTPSRASSRSSSAPTPAVEAKPPVSPPATQPSLNTSEPYVTEGPANTPKEQPVEATPAQPTQPSQPTQPGR